MEKKIARILCSFVLFFISVTYCYGQTPSIIQHIRLPLWAELDAYPESPEAQSTDEDIYAYPKTRIKQVAPFIISGMVYGWKFIYTPSDNARGVEEYFELTPIQELTPEVEKITYVSPWLQDGRLNCWCEYTRTEAQIQNYYLWSSIQHPTIHGVGTGDIAKGFDGISEAAENALKQAVREHFRKTIKNKPKEIRGAVLIRELPTLGIKSGQYLINLDFFLECDRILEYKLY